MRVTLPACLLLLATACSGDSPDAGSVPAEADLSTPAARVGAWQAAAPGRPLPAAVSFQEAVTDSVLAAFLARHPVRPTLAYVGHAGGLAVIPVDSGVAPARAVAALRERTREAARAGLCASVAQVRGMYGEGERTLTLPGNDLSRAQEVLAEAERWRAAVREVPGSAPLVWALELLGEPAAVAAAGADPLVREFLPAAMETFTGAPEAVVPDPAPPAGWAPTATATAAARPAGARSPGVPDTQDAGDAEDAEAAEDRIRRGFDALLRAARPHCPAAFR